MCTPWAVGDNEWSAIKTGMCKAQIFSIIGWRAQQLVVQSASAVNKLNSGPQRFQRTPRLPVKWTVDYGPWTVDRGRQDLGWDIWDGIREGDI